MIGGAGVVSRGFLVEFAEFGLPVRAFGGGLVNNSEFGIRDSQAGGLLGAFVSDSVRVTTIARMRLLAEEGLGRFAVWPLRRTHTGIKGRGLRRAPRW